MPITREQLETRLTELKSQQTQMLQQYSAISGAIADIDYWLAEENKPSSAPISPNKD